MDESETAQVLFGKQKAESCDTHSYLSGMFHYFAYLPVGNLGFLIGTSYKVTSHYVIVLSWFLHRITLLGYSLSQITSLEVLAHLTVIHAPLLSLRKLKSTLNVIIALVLA